MMADLSATGRYRVAGRRALDRLQSFMSGGWADEAQVLEEIAATFRRDKYLADPHTAVALNVYARYAQDTGDFKPVVIASHRQPVQVWEKRCHGALGPGSRRP